MNTKQFHLGDILSITSGRMLSPKGVGGVYEILNFMTGSDLYTHQLPRASEVCRPYLAEQQPVLAAIYIPEHCDNWKTWLATQVSFFGEMHDVEQLPKGVYEQKNPIAEAIELKGADNVIVVAIDREEE